MAGNSRSSREIERELEQQRAQLNTTIDEIFNRLTFEDAWNRIGAYMRDNRGDFGQTLGRTIKEKPIAVALTVLGVSWLLFGPSARPHDRRESYGSDTHARGVGYEDRYGSEGRSPFSRNEFDERRATEPAGPAARSETTSSPLKPAACSGTGATSAGPSGPTSSKREPSGSSAGTAGGSSSAAHSLPRASEVSSHREPGSTSVTSGSSSVSSTDGNTASRADKDSQGALDPRK